jgi:uncharacterized protein with gpF-like domain
MLPIVAKVEEAINRYAKIIEDDKIRTDSIESALFFELNEIQKEIEKEFEDDKMFAVVATIVVFDSIHGIYDNTLSEMKRYLQKITNSEIPLEKYNIENLQTIMASELRGRVKAEVDKYFKKVIKAFSGKNLARITLGKFLKIIALAGQTLTRSVPAGLARDLVGTFNSKTIQMLSTVMGFSYYRWQTMNDEKVRGKPDGLYPDAIPSHYIMDNLICKWDNASQVSRNDGVTWENKTSMMEPEHPGIAYNCRCIPIPFIKSLLAQVDRSLQ